jgi:hypothetical protein
MKLAITAIVHIFGEDAFAADLDQLPDPGHAFITMRNLRKKDGKPLNYVMDDAATVLYSWNRITFIEILGETTAAAGLDHRPAAAGTTVLGFFRDDG